MKLNCDMGEGYGIYEIGNDEALMAQVDMANLACGFHASDPLRMRNTLAMAKRYRVEVGAHIGYDDIKGFGRRELGCSDEEIEALSIYQIGALQALARSEGIEVGYVKPHGALYHRMMRSTKSFEAIVRAISKSAYAMRLVVFASLEASRYEKIARRYGVELLFEIFADRCYSDQGTLVSRRDPRALITDVDTVVERVKRLLSEGVVTGVGGACLKLKADTLCIHSDTPNAPEIAHRIKEILKKRHEDRKDRAR